MDPNNNPDRSPAETEENSREASMAKERETKEDGRYIIFYSFGDEESEESG